MKDLYPGIIIKKNRVKNIRAGHPWIFSGGIEKKSDSLANGDLCSIYDPTGCFLAIGYFNGESAISLRVLSYENRRIDTNFFIERIHALKDIKERLLPSATDSYRVIFGEGDLLPGLIIDKYADTIIIQLHTLGMDKLRAAIVNAVKAVYNPITIFERSDTRARLQEGLTTQPRQLLFGDNKQEVLIQENGINFWVNFQKGQKTGFFLDQRENRNLVKRYCKESHHTLDCFAYTGGFSINALLGGARKVTTLDISQTSLDYAQKNFNVNRINTDRYRLIAENALHYIQEIKKDEYDCIILDPPSFAKNNKQVKNAVKAYITLNSMALERLPNNGFLVSSSCTAHIDEQTFIKIIHQASVNAGCFVKVVASTLQPFDHTYNLSFPEGRYLKFFILQKM